MSPHRFIRVLFSESRALHEGSAYTLPSTGFAAMMDVYALYAAWYQFGGGQEAYADAVAKSKVAPKNKSTDTNPAASRAERAGYASTAEFNARKIGESVGGYASTVEFGEGVGIKRIAEVSAITENIVTYGRESLIDRAFSECVAQVASMLIREGRDAAMDEAENAEDEYLIPAKVAIRWSKQYLPGALTAQLDYAELADFEVLGYDGLITLFRSSIWAYADAYGGAVWADITEAVKNLHNALKRGMPPKDLMFFIDRIYDLVHNTGSLAEKFSDKAKVTKAQLDQRAAARSIEDFIPFVSNQVRKILISLTGSEAYRTLRGDHN